MEKHQRILLYGKSVILGALEASLRHYPQMEMSVLSPPFPTVQELKALAPDVIVFDVGAPRPEAAFNLLETYPGLLLIGIDPDRDQVLLWSGQQLRELSVQDLVAVIHKEGRGDGETRSDAERIKFGTIPEE